MGRGRLYHALKGDENDRHSESYRPWCLTLARKYFEFTGRGPVSDPAVHPAAAGAGQPRSGNGGRCWSAPAGHRRGGPPAAVGLSGRLHPASHVSQRHHSGYVSLSLLGNCLVTCCHGRWHHLVLSTSFPIEKNFFPFFLNL